MCKTYHNEVGGIGRGETAVEIGKVLKPPVEPTEFSATEQNPNADLGRMDLSAEIRHNLTNTAVPNPRCINATLTEEHIVSKRFNMVLFRYPPPPHDDGDSTTAVGVPGPLIRPTPPTCAHSHRTSFKIRTMPSRTTAQLMPYLRWQRLYMYPFRTQLAFTKPLEVPRVGLLGLQLVAAFVCCKLARHHHWFQCDY